VFFGGRSAEHEVSCVSAVAVMAALAEKGHEAVPIGIDGDGGWHAADPSLEPLKAEGPDVVFEVPGGMIRGPGGTIRFDVAFPVLHGPYGEDGTVQGMFEMAGKPYVGSGVLGSAAAMDKDVAKRLFREAGIPITPFFVVRRSQFEDDPGEVIEELVDEIGLPVFAKPAALGSSVGIGRAVDVEGVKDALQEAFRHGPKAVVEPEITGREIEVAVLQGPRASVPGEIVVRDGWYTYQAKYQDDATELIVPAALDRAAEATVRRLACRAFEVVEGAGLARVDFFYEAGGRGFILNEVNTMPGFTPKSMFPMMWAASGMPYPDLCDELVTLALER
jgi:D-alanine-D-alanine ligase